MVLQNLILEDVIYKNSMLSASPKEEQKRTQPSTEELYARLHKSVLCDVGICFEKDGVAEFSTSQNAFSTGKWKKYTVVEELFFQMEYMGTFEVEILHAFSDKGKVAYETLVSKRVSSDSPCSEKIEIGALKEAGIIYIKLKACENKAYLYAGYYGAQDVAPTQNVKLAIDICTYKREAYVKRNIELIKRDILENPASPCHEKVWVHISDNASSLEGIVETQTDIMVHENKNLGGVGGFTRGIIETQRLVDTEGFTHILLMDDDAVISTNAIEVNYRLLSYLKPQYFGYTIGGKLMVLDTPHIQFEVGATWNNGEVEALKTDMDMRTIAAVIDSETEDKKIDYQGWWYACIPLCEVSENNLPLPLFIHRDDIEYGLRIGRGRFIYMNAICIWHESFAGKMPGVLEYYDVRNQCIVNALHCPTHTKEDFKKQIKTIIMNNMLKFRYEYVEYNIKAVEDFCKGIDWLLACDAQNLHQELSKNNYKSEKIENLAAKYNVTAEQIQNRPRGIERATVGARLFRKLVFHGRYFSDTKEIVITAPQISIHQLYRKCRTIIVDNYGKGLYLEKDEKKYRECKKKLKNVLKLIDKEYDAAVISYREGYQKLTSRAFWKNYLSI